MMHEACNIFAQTFGQGIQITCSELILKFHLQKIL